MSHRFKKWSDVILHSLDMQKHSAYRKCIFPSFFYGLSSLTIIAKPPVESNQTGEWYWKLSSLIFIQIYVKWEWPKPLPYSSLSNISAPASSWWRSHTGSPARRWWKSCIPRRRPALPPYIPTPATPLNWQIQWWGPTRRLLPSGQFSETDLIRSAAHW